MKNWKKLTDYNYLENKVCDLIYSKSYELAFQILQSQGLTVEEAKNFVIEEILSQNLQLVGVGNIQSYVQKYCDNCTLSHKCKIYENLVDNIVFGLEKDLNFICSSIFYYSNHRIYFKKCPQYSNDEEFEFYNPDQLEIF